MLKASMRASETCEQIFHRQEQDIVSMRASETHEQTLHRQEEAHTMQGFALLVFSVMKMFVVLSHSSMPVAQHSESFVTTVVLGNDLVIRYSHIQMYP